jgi:hypothetical protein
MLLALTLLATVGLKIAHERADTLERMQAEKFAANLAKAYVVDSASAAAHGDKSAGAAAKGVVEGLQPETYRKNDVKERQQAPVVVPFDSSEVEFEMSTREETAALIAVSTSFRVFGWDDRRCETGIGGKRMEGGFADSRGGDRRWNDRRALASADRRSTKIVADKLYSLLRTIGQSRRMSTARPHVRGVQLLQRPGRTRRDLLFCDPLPFFIRTTRTDLLFQFITSTSNNALPTTLDPNEPLDPQLVLDFDYTRPATARDDLAALVYDTFHMYPVVLFGQMRDPYYREMRKLFSSYVVHPPPLVIEVDQRSDEAIIVGLLKRLLGVEELPVLMLNGKSAGSWAAIQEWVLATEREDARWPSPRTADNGSFMKLISTESSAKIQEKKLKKRPKGVKDAERAEKERILSPKPIMG